MSTTRLSWGIVSVVVPVLCVLIISASPLAAAWVGDVADVAPIGTVVNQRTGGSYLNIRDAYQAAENGDTLLVGPGEWNCDLGFGTASAWPYLQQDDDVNPCEPNVVWPGYVSIIGSGSNPNDPAGSTIFNGNYDPVGETTGNRYFMTLFGSCGSAGSPMQFKNFAVTGFGSSAFSFGGDDPDESTRKITDPGTGYVEFDNLYVHCAEDRSPSEGPDQWFYVDGKGSGIEARYGDMSHVVVRDCLFDGKNAYGISIVQKRDGSYWTGADWLIEGNTFTNMKAGVLIGAGNAGGLQILDNEFTCMTEYSNYAPAPYGNAGIILAPQGVSSDPGSIKDVLIEGNYFADNAYVPGDPNDPQTHPWAGQDILGECGIQARVHTYGSIENVMIRDNTFAETAGGGVMTRGIALEVTDFDRREIAYATPTGTPGTLDGVSLFGNTFIGMSGPDVEGTIQGTVGNPDPQIYPVSLSAGTVTTGITKLGDFDPNGAGDDDIDVADIDAATGAVRLELITKAVKTSVADTNLDWTVDIMDLGNLADKYGQPGPVSFGDGDTNGDGTVDILDLGNLADDYGKSYDRLPAAASYTGVYSPPIPEPATAVLLSVGAWMIARRRR